MEYNPFTISFGRHPAQFISRADEINEIIRNFEQEPPSIDLYMLTGVRGSGKTVLLTEMMKYFEKKEGWIVVELSPERDLLIQLGSKLCSRPELYRLFLNARLNFSLLGFGVEISSQAIGQTPISDPDTAIARMLSEIKKNGKKLLITVDEVVNNEHVRIFASTFQILLRQDFPIFLLMTGLYDNIYDLQNEKTLTFLYRAPKIKLRPLDIETVKSRYEEIFGLSESEAKEMAELTMGYPFAFQVLGYLYWGRRKDKTLPEVLPEYDEYLDEYVYSKIWSELSDIDIKVISALSKAANSRNSGDSKTRYSLKPGDSMDLNSPKDSRYSSKRIISNSNTIDFGMGIGELRKALGLKPDTFFSCKDRLIRKGVIYIPKTDFLALSLPRFDLFVKNRVG